MTVSANQLQFPFYGDTRHYRAHDKMMVESMIGYAPGAIQEFPPQFYFYFYYALVTRKVWF
jgi:hypothetical protein